MPYVPYVTNTGTNVTGTASGINLSNTTVPPTQPLSIDMVRKAVMNIKAQDETGIYTDMLGKDIAGTLDNEVFSQYTGQYKLLSQLSDGFHDKLKIIVVGRTKSEVENWLRNNHLIGASIHFKGKTYLPKEVMPIFTENNTRFRGVKIPKTMKFAWIGDFEKGQGFGKFLDELLIASAK
jgi:hypothetical protein